MKKGTQNIHLKNLIQELKKLSIENSVRVWKRVATDLERPTRIRRKVNIYKIEKTAKEGGTVVVPGVVLGVGELTKKIDIAAYKFSDAAKKKLGAKAKSIFDVMKKNPKGSKVRIIG